MVCRNDFLTIEDPTGFTKGIPIKYSSYSDTTGEAVESYEFIDYFENSIALRYARNFIDIYNDVMDSFYGNDYSYSGSGCVCRSLVAWFLKEKWNIFSQKMGIFLKVIATKRIYFFRKTMHSLIEPKRFKSWKGGR